MNKHIVVLSSLLLSWGITIAEAQTSTNNSIVRFRLSYGANRFGDVDVELFDHDKPITVSNFLAYVQTERYDNSILTRCIPGFIVQGGEYTIANPFTPALFESTSRITSFGNITNEFSVGTQRSNVLGTLAMAKVPGDPNSASSAWFFNLADNSTNLDVQNGGFTVFGRVKSGQNVLNIFNTFYDYHGIINMTNFLHLAFCPKLYRAPDNAYIAFPELPVAYFGQACPYYSDLFTVQMIMLSGADVVGPKITITSPVAKASVTNDTLIVRGTATDNVGVASVRAYLDTNAPVLATGSNSWSVSITNIPPGTNTIVVEATDTTGNRTRASVTFFRSVRVPLTVLKVGFGEVSGAANGQLLELTRPYTLVAKPAPGNLFAGWTGAVTEASTSLRFIMETNLSFTAVFRTNLFPGVKGTYTGLFYDTNQVDQRSSGLITLTLSDQGSYSGRMLQNGKTYRLTGVFNPDGGETNTVVLSDLFDDARLLLRADLNGGSDQITGLVTNDHWGFAQVTLDRAVFGATNPTSLAGNYTLIVPNDTNTATGPDGIGHATLKLDAKGKATISGLLADNTKISVKTTLSKNGALPVYLPLYKGAGALVSWLMFDTNQPTTDFSGLLNWFRQTQPAAKYYKRGFTNEVTVQGSHYAAPATGTRTIALTNGVIGFTNGNLVANFANTVTLGTDNKFVNNSTNKLTLTLTSSKGLLGGSVFPPGNPRSLPIKGVLLQKQNRGAGFVFGTDESSQMLLGP